MGISQLLFYFLIIIPSAMVHEVAHGLAALALGDDTAQKAGRLTLNPLVHIDIFGTILMPVFLLLFSGGSFMFAYAKPVPYNPYNLKSEKDEVKIALAGPLSNFILAGFFALLARSIYTLPIIGGLSAFLALIVIANIGLAIFNLIPIPPLDGSKLLYLLIPKRDIQLRLFLNQYGFIFLMFFILFGFNYIFPIIIFLTRLFLGPLSLF